MVSERAAAQAAATYQAARRLPTLAYGVLREGALAFRGSAGADVTDDTQFRIGSITKTMTAVLVLRCREDGLLDLDDPLGRFVPESGYRDLSLRSLLSHTSGIRSEPIGPWWERTEGGSFEDLLAADDGSSRIFEPGTTFHYSNLGFALLGEVVARLRHRSWYDEVRMSLLEPLGLGRTSYLPTAPHAQGLSVHHLRGTLDREPHADTGAMAPAGQLWSTIEDLARFVGFLHRGDERVLSRAVLTEMQIPVLGEYGLGTQVFGLGGDLLVGHSGSMPGFQACALIAQGSGDGVVALTNATTGFVADEFARVLLGAEERAMPVEPWRPSIDVPDWAEELLGTWHWGNSAYELRWHNERLEFHDLARHRLAEQFTASADGPIVGVAGYHHGETLDVVRRTDGSIRQLECATFVYTRVPYDPSASVPGGTAG